MILEPFPEPEDLAIAAVVKAYIYGYPLVFMEQLKQAATQTSVALTNGQAPINQFSHVQVPPTPASRFLASPNLDTLYSMAWLALTAEPLVLHVPDTRDRYYSLQLIDVYTNTFGYIGKRATGTKEWHYVIVGPDWQGGLPGDLPVVRTPTNLVYVLGRTVFTDEQDLLETHALQQQYTVTPWQAWQHSPVFWTRAEMKVPGSQLPPEISPADIAAQVMQLSPLEFFQTMLTLMQRYPLPAQNDRVFHLFEQGGIHAKVGLRGQSLSAIDLGGLEEAVHVAQQLLKAKLQTHRVHQNGWSISFNLGDYGDNFLLRAQFAQRGLFVNWPAEAIYPYTIVDQDGQRLHGSHAYVLHFNPDELPPVAAFWSITMHTADNRLVENPLNRYAISDRTQGLQYNQDGSLDIYIQRWAPEGKQANWLPAPAENFNLILRLYIPKPEVLDRTYQVPGVKRLVPGSHPAY